MTKPFKVLSIDGGGIRGIIPAMVLAEIEKLTGERISSLFDLIVGTSTGGILALGLVKPTGPPDNLRPEHTAARLVELYQKEGGNIFNLTRYENYRQRYLQHLKQGKGWEQWWNKHIEMLPAQVFTETFIKEKYHKEQVKAVLSPYFKGPRGWHTRLREALTSVIVTSYDIGRREPFLFRSKGTNGDPIGDYTMRQVALATSAAPTYFEPEKIKTRAFVDGGVFANNPALVGYIEARKLLDKKKAATRGKEYTQEDNRILVASLGTGTYSEGISYDKAKTWGLLSWGPLLFDVVMDGVSDTIEAQMQHLLRTPEGKAKRYYRFQTRLRRDNNDMDNASEGNIKALQKAARDLIKDKEDELKSLCKQLEENG